MEGDADADDAFGEVGFLEVVGDCLGATQA